LLGEEDLPHPAGGQLLEQEVLAVIAADLQLGLRYRHEFWGPLANRARVAGTRDEATVRSQDWSTERALPAHPRLR